MTERQQVERETSQPHNFSIKSNSTDILPNGFQYCCELDLMGKHTILREISIDVFDVTIDFGFVNKDGHQSSMLNVYKTRNINPDGSAGREGFVLITEGKRNLSERRYFVSTKIKPLSSAREVMDFVFNLQDSFKSGMGDRTNISGLNVVPMITIEEKDKQSWEWV